MWLATLTPVFPSLVMFMPETEALLALGGLIVFAIALGLFLLFRKGARSLWSSEPSSSS